MARKLQLLSSMTNAEVAELFYEMADLLDIQGGNPFRIRAYRNAAWTVETLPRNLQETVERGEPIAGLPSIGKDLAGKILEILSTGSFRDLVETEKKTPKGIRELLKVKSLGPKRVALLHKKLKIRDLIGLEQAIHSGKLREVRGFGEKLEQSILQSIVDFRQAAPRILLPVAEQWALELEKYIQNSKMAKKVTTAGSLRRRKETIGDLDILATSRDPKALMEYFVNYPNTKRVLSKGATRSTIELNSGLQVDLRVIPEKSYGAALYYFTGSKSHNVALRLIAAKKGYKINEYGVFRGAKRVAGVSEREIFDLFNLDFIPPELRENKGEIKAALERSLPKLIELKDIKGDLHVHTKRTDGRASLPQMAEAAKARGYEYIAITDHTKSLTVAKGQTARELEKQIAEINRVQRQFPDLTILKSAEVDILEDGRLDLPSSILKKLDVVVCAVHSQFNLSRAAQTKRILRALENPYCHILAHPSTRLLGERKPIDIDFEAVLKSAQENRCALEVNGQPNRLDLNEHQCRAAIEMGVPLVLSTDAHDPASFDFMRFAVAQARRGWVEARHVMNTRKLSEFQRFLRKGKLDSVAA